MGGGPLLCLPKYEARVGSLLAAGGRRLWVGGACLSCLPSMKQHRAFLFLHSYFSHLSLTRPLWPSLGPRFSRSIPLWSHGLPLTQVTLLLCLRL